MKTSEGAAPKRSHSRIGGLLILCLVLLGCSSTQDDEAAENAEAPTATTAVDGSGDAAGQAGDAAATAEDAAEDAAQSEAEAAAAAAAAAAEAPDLAPGQLFFEDFTGNSSMARFEVGLYHRDDHLIAEEAWLGDHAVTGPGDLCGPPEEKREIVRGERDEDFNLDWVYRCVPGGDLEKAHMMTAIGDTSGYSIGAFTPTETFTGVREVRWDVNLTDLGFRQFTEVKIIPVDEFDFQKLPCAKDLPCNTPEVGEVGGVAVSFFNHKLHIHDGTSLTKGPDEWYDMYPSDPALSSIKIRRTQIFRDNGDGTLTFGVEREDGSFEELTVSGSFPSGPVKVVFADHNYTPNKLGPTSFTWHWDNIEVWGEDGQA